MKSDQILESLSQLDPDNDDHWTQDGQPRLGAVGEGVSRQSILDVAPLFSRKNPVLPEQLSDEEVEQVLGDELEAIQQAKDEAEDEIRKAVEAREAADAKLAAAEDKLNDIRRSELFRDTRSDTEINRDYLRSEFEQRLQRAKNQSTMREMLEAAGATGRDFRMLTGSPLDRNIAARVKMSRRGG